MYLFSFNSPSLLWFFCLLGYLLASSMTSRSLASSALVRWYWSGSLRAVSKMSKTTVLMSLGERAHMGR